jgi:phospholipid/cholesterol/gamma-HCH transport system substrate-binding protein
MRRANTTFVNLRSALNEVDPLVDASKPVAKRLGPFLTQARAFAADAEPTVRDLSRTVRRPGPANDLINLLSSFPPLADIAVATERRTASPGGRPVDVGVTDGAFQETVEAFKKATPEIALGRAYTTDFLGWADDFSTTGGGFDAVGAMGRGHISFAEALFGPARTGQYRRCPGAAEAPAADGSNVLSAEQMAELQCDESARAVGDVK